MHFFSRITALFLLSLGLLQAQTWQPVGGPPGAIINTMIQAPDASIYLSAGHTTLPNGSLLRSTDYGDTWVDMSAGLPAAAVHALAAGSSGDLLAGGSDGQVYHWTRGADTWDRTGNLHRSGRTEIFALLISPTGSFLAGTRNGIIRSDNGGTSWTQVFSPPGEKVRALQIDASGMLYAGGSTGLLYRSDDDGRNWDIAVSGLINSSIHALAFDTQDLLLIGTGQGILRSTDKGLSWTRPLVDRNNLIQRFAFGKDGELFAGSIRGLFVSHDRGASWQLLSGLHKEYAITGIVPGQGQEILISSSNRLPGSLLRSTDQGTHWDVLSVDRTTSVIYSIAALAGGTIVTQSGSHGIFRTIDGGKNWDLLIHGAPFNRLIGARQSGEFLFAASPDTLLRSIDQGRSWQRTFPPLIPMEITTIFNDNRSGLLVASKNRLLRSSDGGDNWYEITAIPEGQSIRGLAWGPDNWVYAGAERIGILASQDNGNTWTMFASRFIGVPLNALLADHRNHVIVLLNNGFHRSSDEGRSWQFISEGIRLVEPEADRFNALLLLPTGALLAATNKGIFHSPDDGVNWRDISEGIPDPNVFSLSISTNGVLYAGTMGHGVFRRSSALVNIRQEALHSPGNGSIPRPRAYPNPAISDVRIEIPTQTGVNVTMQIFNSRGALMLTVEPIRTASNKQTFIVDAASLGSGVYYYRVGASPESGGTFVIR